MDEEYVDYETHRIHFHKVKQKDVEEEIIFKIQAILYVLFFRPLYLPEHRNDTILNILDIFVQTLTKA